jgi:hypothetical protein
VRTVQGPLAPVGQSSSNDPDQAFFWFCMDDDHQPAIDGADRDEAVFGFRVLRVEDLEIVSARQSKPLTE